MFDALNKLTKTLHKNNNNLASCKMQYMYFNQLVVIC